MVSERAGAVEGPIRYQYQDSGLCLLNRRVSVSRSSDRVSCVTRMKRSQSFAFRWHFVCMDVALHDRDECRCTFCSAAFCTRFSLKCRSC